MNIVTSKIDNRYIVYIENAGTPYKIKWNIRENSRVLANQLLGFVDVVSDSASEKSHHLDDEMSQNEQDNPTVHSSQETLSTSSSSSSSIRIFSPSTGRFSICPLNVSALPYTSAEPSLSSGQPVEPSHEFLFQVIEKECSHSILVEGLCSDCGKTIAVNTLHAQSQLEVIPSSSFSANDESYTRKLGFVSPNTSILVSSKEAKRLELEKIQSLLKAKKLPLILDLDNTLLHAYPFPPPPDIGEVLEDSEFRVVQLDDPSLYLPYKPLNSTEMGTYDDSAPRVVPHYDIMYTEEDRKMVEKRWESWVICVVSYDVSTSSAGRHKSSDLPLSDYGSRPYPCYFKLRPGVLEFLRETSKKFELYLFTAGAAVHAMSSLKVLDPERRWFGFRVFTREDLPYLDSGALGLKTIQRIFPGESSTQNLVTVVDDCESVWSPDSNLFKVHAYHWWPDPSLHPFLLLYCRRTPSGAGSHSEIPVKIVDPGAFSRIRAAAFSMLNFCPSIIEMCKSPRRVSARERNALCYASRSLDGGHSTPDMSYCETGMDDQNVDNHSQNLKCDDSSDSPSVIEHPISVVGDISQNSKAELGIPNGVNQISTHSSSQELEGSTQENDNMLENTIKIECNGAQKRDWSFSNRDAVLGNDDEAPRNKKLCVSWLQKGFDQRQQGETQEELNARVLKTTTESWKAPNVLKDTDRQLDYLLSILCELHHTFFSQINEHDIDNLDVEKLPNVKSILDSMRQRVLQNVILQATGIREASIPDFHDTDLGRSIIALGGRLVAHHQSGTATHLLVGKETKFYIDALKKAQFPHSAHLMWLEAALFTFRRYDESLFTVDQCEKQYRVFWDALECHKDSSGCVPLSLPFTTSVNEYSSDVCETPGQDAENLDVDTLEKHLLDDLV